MMMNKKNDSNNSGEMNLEENSKNPGERSLSARKMGKKH